MPANFNWSEICTIHDNIGYGVSEPILAHELGHSLGLDHHTGTNAAVMEEGTTLTGPTDVDIGVLPPCSGYSYQNGVRCIFEWPN
ncbi:MAG TPA: hypothetical protein DEV93_04150 [Chloroflexi bacterium]|nr:hypothetical protein [Chloroflexota bacterium]